jgi:hypothetical protein
MSSRPSQLFRSDRLSPRAQAICRGLLISGRIRPLASGMAPVEAIRFPIDGDRTIAERVLRLEGTSDVFYYVSLSGEHLFRGASADDVDELAGGFVDAMEKLGVGRKGLEVVASQPQSSLARVCA